MSWCVLDSFLDHSRNAVINRLRSGLLGGHILGATSSHDLTTKQLNSCCLACTMSPCSPVERCKLHQRCFGWLANSSIVSIVVTVDFCAIQVSQKPASCSQFCLKTATDIVTEWLWLNLGRVHTHKTASTDVTTSDRDGSVHSIVLCVHVAVTVKISSYV